MMTLNAPFLNTFFRIILKSGAIDPKFVRLYYDNMPLLTIAAAVLYLPKAISYPYTTGVTRLLATNVPSSFSQGSTISAKTEEFFGIYLQKQKIGFSTFRTEPTKWKLNGSMADAMKSNTEMSVSMGLIGSDVTIKVQTETISINGKPVHMEFFQESAGRTQRVKADFSKTEIKASVDNNGAKSTASLAVPTDGAVVDDVLTPFLGNASAKTQTFYVFDPSTVTVVKNTAKSKGKQRLTYSEDGKQIEVEANVIEVSEPRLTTTIYLTSSGSLIKATSTLGIDYVRETKALATKPADPNQTAPDLAAVSSIVPTPSINNPLALKALSIELKADNTPPIPNDSSQQAKKKGDSWSITVAPVQLQSSRSVSIASAGAQKAEWKKPSMLIPSTSNQFRALAKKIIGKKTDVKSATLAIRQWVHDNMTANAGIGVLRDASEVLKAKEGVCRDYAILTTTILRAAGIPTRLASGIVNFDETFYYHAWSEVWTGYDWVGVDSIPDSAHFTATHLKMSQGNVDKAFSFTILSNATIKVISAR
jgi:hypothetical protein